MDSDIFPHNHYTSVSDKTGEELIMRMEERRKWRPPESKSAWWYGAMHLEVESEHSNDP